MGPFHANPFHFIANRRIRNGVPIECTKYIETNVHRITKQRNTYKTKFVCKYDDVVHFRSLWFRCCCYLTIDGLVVFHRTMCRYSHIMFICSWTRLVCVLLIFYCLDFRLTFVQLINSHPKFGVSPNTNVSNAQKICSLRSHSPSNFKTDKLISICGCCYQFTNHTLIILFIHRFLVDLLILVYNLSSQCGNLRAFKCNHLPWNIGCFDEIRVQNPENINKKRNGKRRK